jgi:hypothetical protein
MTLIIVPCLHNHYPTPPNTTTFTCHIPSSPANITHPNHLPIKTSYSHSMSTACTSPELRPKSPRAGFTAVHAGARSIPPPAYAYSTSPYFSYTLPYDPRSYIIQRTQTQILLHPSASATCICTTSARTHRKVYRTWTHSDRPEGRHVSFGLCFRSRGAVVASLGVMGWWRGCFVLLYLAQDRECEA